MRLRLLDWAAWFCVMLVVAGFMMPWFLWPQGSAAKPQVEDMVERLTAESDQGWFVDYFGMTGRQIQAAGNLTGDSVAGYNLPMIFSNPDRLEAAERLRRAEVLGEKRQDDRAWFAYAVPVLAILTATFVAFVPRRWALLLPLAGCAFLYGAIRYTLAMSYYDRMAAAVEVGPGLWVALYGLLALWAVTMLRLFLPEDSRF